VTTLTPKSLPTISELISLDFTPEVKKRKKAKVSPLSVPLDWPDDAKPPSRYEYHVFKFLLENKDALGIQTVFKFENLRVDGAILLLLPAARPKQPSIYAANGSLVFFRNAANRCGCIFK
jgi:hypothetical protein